jgi:GntR family transcriptional regulator/MocR family aminotransferase
MRHLRRARQQYAARRSVLVERLHERFGNVELMGTDAGTHIAWRLPASFAPAHNTKAIARARNIGVYTVQSGGGHEYNGSQFEANWLLLGYASLSEDQIQAGIDRLADAIIPTDAPKSRLRGLRIPLAPT